MAEENKLANPAPLGLMGFGMTTVLLNIHNAGFFKMDPMILAMGVFYGGLAQIFAGHMEFKKGNTFGTVAFTSYGLFWLTLVSILSDNAFIHFGAGSAHVQDKFIGWYMFLWGLFTAFMFIGTLKANRALQFVFASLTILFWILAAGFWTMPKDPAAVPHSTAIKIIRAAGWEGIICGASAIYLAMAEVLEEQLGRPVLPIGKP